MDKLKTIIETSDQKLTTIGPDLLLAICFLAAGVLIAFGTKKLALVAIKKYHSDRSGKNVGLISTKQFNWFAIILSRATFWLTIIIFVALTTEMLGINIFEEWLKAIGNYVPNILAGILIMVTGFILSGFLKNFLQKTLKAAGIRRSHNIAIAGYVISIVIVLLIAVTQVGIDLDFLTSIILILVSSFLLCGAISFGLGSAPIVTNIISTYYLRKDLKVGQRIDCNGIDGRVMEINATSVHLQSSEGLEVIPSAKLNKIGYRIKNVSS